MGCVSTGIFREGCGAAEEYTFYAKVAVMVTLYRDHDGARPAMAFWRFRARVGSVDV